MPDNHRICAFCTWYVGKFCHLKKEPTDKNDTCIFFDDEDEFDLDREIQDAHNSK